MRIARAARRVATERARRVVGEQARRRRYFRRVIRRGETKDFLFVSGPGGEARRYRCDHQREQLELLGFSADVGYHDELDLGRLIDRYERVVLYRVAWDERVEHLLVAARRLGKQVLADVDDLVFDPQQARLLHHLSVLADDERPAYEDSIRRLRQTLAAVDGVVVSTQPLVDAARGAHDRVAVAHNAVSRRMVEAGRRARTARATRRGRDDLVIAYLSGTATHDRDFLEAADAVLWALDRYSGLRFFAVGHLALDERFVGHPRVVRVPFTPWHRLPRLLAEIDVNLAPLESENAFTNSKSCLKYLEAAVVAVPTVASPTADFRRAITSGVNGILAQGEAAWREAFQALAESPELRRRLGDEAHRDVLERHTTAARAQATAAAFASFASPLSRQRR